MYKPVSFSGLCFFEQMGQQSIALGLKFNAKAVLDCFEKELEILPHGRRREIDFKMVEGDFQLFEGKWSIEQVIISYSNTFIYLSTKLVLMFCFSYTVRQRGGFGFTV